MKKIIFLLLIFLSACKVSAQTVSYENFKKWSYGITLAGTSNFRILTSDGSENFLKGARKNSEIRRTGFSAGLIANYRITDLLSINSGLVYDDFGYKTRDQNLSYSDGTNITASNAYHFHYITIPLDLKYDFLKKSGWNLYLGGGVSPAVFIGETNIFNYGSSKNKDTQAVGYDRFNLVGDLRGGADFWLADNMKLTAGLYYKQFINSTNSNLPTKSYLNSAGVTAGFIYVRRNKHH